MALVKEKDLLDFYFQNLEANKFGIAPEIVEEGILSWLGGKVGAAWGEFSNGFKDGAGSKEKIESALAKIGDSSPEGLKKLKQLLSDEDIANMDSTKLGAVVNGLMKKLSPEEQKQVVEYFTNKKVGDVTQQSTSDKLAPEGEEKPLTVAKGTSVKLAPIMAQIQDSTMRNVANNAVQVVIAAARKSKSKEDFMKMISTKLFKNAVDTKKSIENNKNNKE
jgi:hypothetical protein